MKLVTKLLIDEGQEVSAILDTGAEVNVISYKLVNNLGAIVLIKTINHVSGASLENLKLNNISSGIYLLQVCKAGKQTFTAKVIIE